MRAAAIARARQLLLLRRLRSSSRHPTLLLDRPSFRRCLCSDGSSGLRDRILLLTEKPPASPHVDEPELDELRPEISDLVDALLALPDDRSAASLLDSRSSSASLLLLRPSPAASLALLSRLHHRPGLALHVFDWRRRQPAPPPRPEEYAKAVALAGRAMDVTAAAEIFEAAGAAGARTTSVYNALMGAYVCAGLTRRALALFEDLKQDPGCNPTIVTYNILFSAFGRSMLINQMEDVLCAIEHAGLTPTIKTYNTVIAAYVTSWMWDRMEKTLQQMAEGPVKPDLSTHLLMLRGYAHAGNLEKMEQSYEIVREHVNGQEVPLIRMMIYAYCKSSDPERVHKIESLAKHIPDGEYRPWLNVLLIRLYAQEGLVEAMERFISEALQRNTVVTTVGVMRSIISSYFRFNAVDKLAGFIKQAEDAGWRLCRSLYHCKMVMYGQQNRLEEMHSVLDEMEVFNFDPTRKTFLIMYKAYSNIGRRSEAETVIGMMWKHGFGNPHDVFFL